MDLIRARALIKVIVGACDELTLALKEDVVERPALTVTHVVGWPTSERIQLLRRWYPSHAPSSLIFKALRAMDGPQPGTDAAITTYAAQKLKLKRPNDIRNNPAMTARAAREFCENMGWPEPVDPAAKADPGVALWHPWASIKELARRDGVILDGMDDLPRYNKRREARGLPPLYLKTFKTGASGDD